MCACVKCVLHLLNLGPLISSSGWTESRICGRKDRSFLTHTPTCFFYHNGDYLLISSVFLIILRLFSPIPTTEVYQSQHHQTIEINVKYVLCVLHPSYTGPACRKFFFTLGLLHFYIFVFCCLKLIYT